MEIFRTITLFVIGLSIAGCGEISQVTGSTFHQKFGWKAEDYFTDPKVIALCHAIEANDLAEIDRQIAAGDDVNAKGKDGMTPLLWAFPDNKLERFTKLLEQGADPNVVIKSDLNTHGGFRAGDSVTHMACRTEFPGYFEAVFAHSGDPNFIKNGAISGQTPLFSVIEGIGPDKKKHVQLLIEKRANLDHMDGGWSTPVMEAVSWGAQFDIALMLLDAGADYKLYKPKSNTKLIHIVSMVGDNQNLRQLWSPQQKADYEKLIKWLEDHGESIEQAKADIKRWQSYNTTTPEEYRRKMDAEIAEREAREAKEKTQHKVDPQR